jgi:hypothetical protein
MKSTWNLGLPSMGVMLLLCTLQATSAQYIEVIHRPAYQPAYYYKDALERHLSAWHDTFADLDSIFSALDTSHSSECTPVAKLHEQIKIDSNKTSHLYLSVHEHQRCKGETPLDIADAKVSVLENLLTVTGNTSHGAFTRSYHLPEHAVPGQITAVYAQDKVLHVSCPSNTPPPTEPVLVDVVVEQAPPAAAASPQQSGNNEWTDYQKGQTTSHSASPTTSQSEEHKDKEPADTNSTAAGGKSTETPPESAQSRRGVEEYIKTLEADLARLKSMM